MVIRFLKVITILFLLCRILKKIKERKKKNQATRKTNSVKMEPY